MPNIIREGDSAVGHTDILGNPVTGVVQAASCAQSVRNGGKKVATANTIVSFASHAHEIIEGQPATFQAHSVVISATGKHRAGKFNIAVENDSVGVADVAGPAATLVASQSNLRCASNL